MMLLIVVWPRTLFIHSFIHSMFNLGRQVQSRFDGDWVPEAPDLGSGADNGGGEAGAHSWVVR